MQCFREFCLVTGLENGRNRRSQTNSCITGKLEIFLCNFDQIFHYFKQFRGIFEVGNSIFCSSLVVEGHTLLDLDQCQSRSRLAI